MNGKQKICLWIGIAVIVLMSLFPPWLYTQARITEVQTNAGYHFLLTPPQPQGEVGYGIHLDMSRLFVQWIVIIAIAAGLIVSFQEKEKGKS